MSRKSLSVYERIIAPAPDHISIVSREYEYLVANDAYLKCHGRKKEEIVGRKVPELLGEQVFMEQVKANLDRCFAGESVNFRAWFDFKASGRRFMNVIYYPYVIEGAIEGAVVVSRDITDYRTAEQKLRDSEEKYRHLFENLNDAAMLADCETGLINEANIQAEALIGLPREQIIGMHQSSIHPPARALEYRDKFAAHIARGRAFDYEGEVIRSDGTIVPVFISAAPVTLGGKKYILGLFRDINERKRSEAALLESQHLAESIIASMQDGFLVFDSTGRFLDGNPAFFRMVGYSRDELAGLPLPYPFCSEKDADTIMGVFAGLEKGIRKDYELNLMKKDGALFPVLWSPSNLAGKDGAVKNYFATVKDITSRKKMESGLLTAHKLDSLGKLSGGLAHDLDNILTGILSNISLAIFHGQPDQPLKRLEAAQKEALRAKGLMSQFLTFARGSTPIKKTLDLTSFLPEWPRFALAGSNVKCELSIDDGLKPVDADEDMLSLAFRSVVVNAAESMPGGGTVKITARNGEAYGSGLLNGPAVIITVEDSGAGVDEKNMERIFDPYYTTKDGAGGLGLSIACHVIEDHGGRIEIESSPGKGTLVSIKLPASGPQPRA